MSWRVMCAVLAAAAMLAAGCSGPDAPNNKKKGLRTQQLPAPAITAVA